MNMRWLNFPFQPNINVETTLGHQHWINVTLSTLFQRCFVNFETTSINTRRLNFHFQPIYQRWNNVDERWQSTLFQRWFNVDVFAALIHHFLSNGTNCSLLGLEKTLITGSASINFYWKVVPKIWTWSLSDWWIV